ncbi:hypothetical protein ACVME8_010454 [Bradyrhizobium diazoefficiens]
MGSLQKEFASITVYDNLDALVQAHPDVAVMLGTYSRLVSKRDNQVEARFMVKFYDSNLQYIGKAEGSREQQMPPVWVHGKRRSRPIRKGLAWGLQSVDQRVCKSLAGGMEAATTENYEVRPNDQGRSSSIRDCG